MASKTKQQSMELIDLFVLCYTSKTGRKPVVNRYKEKWGFQDMIDSIGYERSVEIVKFYFETSNAWTPVSLFNIFDKLDESLRRRDEDRARREKLREKTLEALKEWDAQHES